MMVSKTSHPTLRDLRREAEGSLPTMLAVTVLVQVLGALARRGQGTTMSRLSLDDVLLTGAPPHALIADPSRDPRIRLVDDVASPAGAPRPLCGAGVLFRQLVTGPRGEMAPAAARLLRRLETRGVCLEQALAEARETGLEMLAAWDQRRDTERSVGLPVDEAGGSVGEEVEARQQLANALYAGCNRDVLRHGRELSRLLGEAASVDEDLAVARGWLEDQEKQRSHRREVSKQVSLKLILTGAPLIFATLLTGLLGVVMLFSV